MLVTETMAREAWQLLTSYHDGGASANELIRTREPATLTEDNVKAAHRIAVGATHPDRGGTSEAFIAVDRAKCILAEWLKKQPVSEPTDGKKPCNLCDGKGHTYSASRRPGSKGLRRQCEKCHGSGDANFDSHGLYSGV